MADQSITHLPCTKCKLVKPVSVFLRDPKRYLSRDGYRHTCKPCRYEYGRATLNKRQRTRYHASRAAYAIKHAQLKAKAFTILGGKCSRCPVTDFRCLQIDHVNGGGYEERKRISIVRCYKKIIAGEIDGYQLLCANCNWIKRFENSEHGHHVKY